MSMLQLSFSFFFFSKCSYRPCSSDFKSVSASTSSSSVLEFLSLSLFLLLLLLLLWHHRRIRTSVPVLHIVATSIPSVPIHVDMVNLVSSIVPGLNVSRATGFNIVNGTPININIIRGVLPPLVLFLMYLICNTMSTIVIASDICRNVGRRSMWVLNVCVKSLCWYIITCHLITCDNAKFMYEIMKKLSLSVCVELQSVSWVMSLLVLSWRRWFSWLDVYTLWWKTLTHNIERERERCWPLSCWT